eukprot:8771106-Karenia_brevis.AAC.1
MPLTYKAHQRMIDTYTQHRSQFIVGLHLLLSSHCVALSDVGGLSWMEIFLLSAALTHDPVGLTHGVGAVA